MGNDKSHSPFTVVGIGPGECDYLLPAGADEINRADLLIGGARHLALFQHLGKESLSLAGNIARLPSLILEHREQGRIVILVSGDPGYYSLLGLISRHFSLAEYRVIPGISSFQLAAARTGLPWQDDLLLSLHGREPADWISRVQGALQDKRRVFFLTDALHTPLWIGKTLSSAMVSEERIDKLRIELFYRLGHGDETYETHFLPELISNPEKNNKETLCLMIINPV